MEPGKAKPSNRKFWGIALTVMVLPAIIICALVFPPYTWGAEGKLSLSISLDRTAMGINDSMNITLTLKNIGDQKVRISETYGDFSFTVKDVRGTILRSTRLVMVKMAPERYPGGNSLKELPPEGSLSKTFTLLNSTYYDNYLFASSTNSYGYDFQPGETYTVNGAYENTNSDGFPTLPHWKGSLKTDEKPFSITM